MEKKSYSEKLKDPRWQKKRLEVLERDKWTCQYCGSTEKTLHVHHKKYVRDQDPWDSDESILITACVDCHEYETTARREIETKLLDILRVEGFSAEDLVYLAEGFSNADTGMNKAATAMMLYELLRNKRLFVELSRSYLEFVKNI